MMMKNKVFSKRSKHLHRYQRQHRQHYVTHRLALECSTMVIACMMMGTVTAAASTLSAIGGSRLNFTQWPPLKYHDIWGNDDLMELESTDMQQGDDGAVYDTDPHDNESDFNLSAEYSVRPPRTNPVEKPASRSNLVNRQEKVIHLFPVPVDGECLSDDGRRTGSCFNAYECRNKGGQARGECAHGFGVCCIFIANCNETVSNNITYLVSPSFPSFMPNNVTNCNLKIKLNNDDISQVRIDFHHFILGQPNRRTGVCDGDVFNVSGGPSGVLSLCGQNSGQHIYYDVGGRMLPRQALYGTLRPLRYDTLYPSRNSSNESSTDIEIGIHFAPRFLPARLWEIRIVLIPFSQRAPVGCLQYFTGSEGVFQTFNFADNGRHLANQNYRICMRQEVDMCSIVYQPCDEQSFRIGPGSSLRFPSVLNTVGSNEAIIGDAINPEPAADLPIVDMLPAMDETVMQVLANYTTGTPQMNESTTVVTSLTLPDVTSTTTPTSTSIFSPTMSPIPDATTEMSGGSGAPAADDPSSDEPATESSDSSLSPVTTTGGGVTTTTFTTVSTLSDDVEGSGGEEDSNTRLRPITASTSPRPRPTRGGFDLLGFLRSAFDFGLRGGRHLNERQKRQFYSSCRDRITMPCIVEDFIGTGLGPLPGCEPVHCGMQFCSNGMWPCRIESTVTPFYVSIHFGDGAGKGSPEDNIGACLRYQQVLCMR